MFKVHNKNNRTNSNKWFWCFYWTWNIFYTFFRVSIVDFEQENVSWKSA